mgnify:CR=1 FL=1
MYAHRLAFNKRNHKGLPKPVAFCASLRHFTQSSPNSVTSSSGITYEKIVFFIISFMSVYIFAFEPKVVQGTWAVYDDKPCIK